MRELQELAGRAKLTAVGLISGTSVDGVDAVLAEIEGSGPDLRITQLGRHSSLFWSIHELYVYE